MLYPVIKYCEVLLLFLCTVVSFFPFSFEALRPLSHCPYLQDSCSSSVWIHFLLFSRLWHISVISVSCFNWSPLRDEWEKYPQCYGQTRFRAPSWCDARIRCHHLAMLLPLLFTTLRHRGSHSSSLTQTLSRQQLQCPGPHQECQLASTLPRLESSKADVIVFFHSFIFSTCIILVKFIVNVKPIPGTFGLR